MAGQVSYEMALEARGSIWSTAVKRNSQRPRSVTLSRQNLNRNPSECRCALTCSETELETYTLQGVASKESDFSVGCIIYWEWQTEFKNKKVRKNKGALNVHVEVCSNIRRKVCTQCKCTKYALDVQSMNLVSSSVWWLSTALIFTASTAALTTSGATTLAVTATASAPARTITRTGSVL